MLDRSLRVQLRIFLVIYLIMTVIVLVRIFRDDISPLWAVEGFVIGLVIGWILTRTKVLGWSREKQQVVGTSDLIGIVLLISYLILVIFRNRIVGHWIHDRHAVAVIGFSLTAGAMVGRVYFTMHGIRAILRAADLPLLRDEPTSSA